MRGPLRKFWRFLNADLEPADGIRIPFLLVALSVAVVGKIVTKWVLRRRFVPEAPDVDVADISAYRPQPAKPAPIR